MGCFGCGQKRSDICLDALKQAGDLLQVEATSRLDGFAAFATRMGGFHTQAKEDVAMLVAQLTEAEAAFK